MTEINKKIEKIILPSYFMPKFRTQLIRLGKNYDGGYLVPIKSIENTNVLLSFGLNDDFSFEEDFSKKKDINIYCYDNSVNWKFWIKKFISDIKNLFLFRIKKNDLEHIFIYLKYLFFFNSKKKTHYKKFIAPKGTKIPGVNGNDITDLNEIFSEKNINNVFLKIDIEGSEYRILDQIIKYQSSIEGLVIEFHECDINKDLIKKFINNFDLKITHLHVNNWSLVNPQNFPSSIEFTFSPKNYCKTENYVSLSLPLDLDQPCNPSSKDIPVEFIEME